MKSQNNRNTNLSTKQGLNKKTTLNNISSNTKNPENTQTKKSKTIHSTSNVKETNEQPIPKLTEINSPTKSGSTTNTNTSIKIPTNASTNQSQISLPVNLSSKNFICPKCRRSIPLWLNFNLPSIEELNNIVLNVNMHCLNCRNKTMFPLNDLIKVSASESIPEQSFCKTHPEKPNIYHCIQCNKEICESCSSLSHYSHKSQTLTEFHRDIAFKLPFNSISEFEFYTSNIIQKNLKDKQEMIKKIDLKIQELINIKKEIEKYLDYNNQINKNLIILLRILYSGFLDNKNKNLTVLENFAAITQFANCPFKFPLSTENVSIETQSASLITYFKYTFIVQPYHIYTRPIYSNKIHASGIVSLIQLSAYDRPIVTGSLDKTIKVYDINSFKVITTLYGHTGGVNHWSEWYNNNILSCSSDGTMKIWNMKTYEHVTTIQYHWSYVFAGIELSNHRLVSCSDDKFLTVLEADTYNILTQYEFTKEVYCCVEIFNTAPENESRKRIAVGCGDSLIYLCYVNNQFFNFFEKMNMTGHKASVRTIMQIKNGNIVSGGNDNTIKIWDVKANDYKCLFTSTDHFLYLNCFCQISEKSLVSCSFDGSVKFWNTDNYQCWYTIKESSSVNCLIILADGRIVTGSNNKALSVLY